MKIDPMTIYRVRLKDSGAAVSFTDGQRSFESYLKTLDKIGARYEIEIEIYPADEIAAQRIRQRYESRRAAGSRQSNALAMGKG